MILTLIGFFGIAGVQRFVVGETGTGILYLVRFGFCVVGTVIDLVNIKSITSTFNRKQAMETAEMVRLMRR